MDSNEYFGSFKEKKEQTGFMKEESKSYKYDPSNQKVDPKTKETKTKEDKSKNKEEEIELEKTKKSLKSDKKFLQDKDLVEIKKAFVEEHHEQSTKNTKKKVPPINEIENHLLRRFSVKIRDIKFHNLQKDYLTIFLQFIIGKDLEKQVYVTAMGRQTQYIQTTSGLRFKTELLKAVEHGELRNVLINYENEYRASYDMLNDENLTIQVWSYNKWRVNTFLGKYSTSLANLANDSMTKAVNIRLVGHSQKKVLGRIYFTGYFQEIWDWKLTFTEWKGFNFVDKNGNTLNSSRLYLTLRTKELREPTVSSSVVKKNTTPYFNELKGNMFFRGTLDELENHFLLIYLKTSKKNVTKLISLRGISQTLYLKTTIKLFDNKDSKDFEDSSKKKNSEEQKPILDGNPDDENNILDEANDFFHGDERNSLKNIDPNKEDEEEEDDELLQDDKNTIYITVEGRVSLNNIPRFKQKGELIRFKKNERYLIVLVNRVESVMAPDDRNRIDSFVSVNWGGNEKFTQTFYDSNQPDFNEELVFRLPGKFSKKLDKIDQLKEELNSRSEIIFNLWIENEDGSNESIGYVKFKLSELDKANKEEKVYFEYYSGRKIKNMCRVSVLTKSFVSAIVDSPNTKIVAQICFFPDIPEKIDLRTLKYDTGDRFPKAINELVNKDVKDGDYSDTDLVSKWDEMIRRNFIKMPLEKNMQRIFVKCLFVKDQYGRQHLVSKFLGRYTIEEKYPADLLNIEKDEKKIELKNDLRMKTYGELAHFVRCIPFFEETRKNNDIWMSSDFLLTLKKGNVQDHAILLANLFMGCDNETNQDIENSASNEKKKNENLNENRVFVCLGTIGQHKPEFHCWVMTIDREFETITFWETMKNEKYELKGRIKSEDRLKLKDFLYNLDKENIKENLFSKLKMGLGGLKNITPTPGRSTKIPNPNDNSSKNPKENGEIIQTDENEEKELELEEELQKIDYKDDIIEIMEDPIMALRDLPNFFQTQSKRKQPKYGVDKIDKKEKGDMNFKGRQPNFLDIRKKEILDDESKNKDMIKLQPITFFLDSYGNKIKHVEMPYYSLEIIFNHKNAWANLQCQNPGAIYYNLNNSEEWGPFIEHNGKTWRDDLGVFYETKGFGPSLTFEECAKKMSAIILELQIEISKVRTGANLETKWKHKNDKTNRHLELLLKMIEYRDTKRCDLNQFNNDMTEWIKEMKKIIPVNYRFSGMPMFFNYFEPEKIRSLIIENAESFYMRKEKIIYLGVAGRIFPYPNRFNSVRLILAIYSKINDEHDTEEEEEIEDFDQINQKLEEEMKINDKVGENGYDALPNDEKHENLDSLNNELVEEGLKELGEDVELE